MPGTLDMILAALPIVTLIVLLFLRVKPLPAVLGAIAVLLLLWFRFPIGAPELSAMAARLTGVTLNVVFILLGGLVLSVFAANSGAQRTMSQWFETAARNPDRAILLYGLGVTPFMEATIGWGMSLIIAVPLLLRAGLGGTRAAIVGLVGLVVCPWGSLGPGLILTAELGGVPLRELGVQSAIYNLPVVLSSALVIGIVGIGRRMTLRLGIELVVTAVVLWGVLLLVNLTLGPALAGVFAGLAVIVVLLVFAKLQGASPRMSAAEARSFGPFALLVVAMLTVIGLAAVVDLGAWEAVITSPGLWLIVSAASGPFFYGMARVDALASLRVGMKRWVPVTITTLSFILFGVLLTVSGMSATLAHGAAEGGAGFLLALPFIGALAGYLTASITSVGTMLAPGVTDAAFALGVDPASALGVQTAAAGSAVGASPTRLVLAASIVASSGEGAAAGGGVGSAADAGSRATMNYGRVALATIGMSLLASAVLSVTLLLAPL